MFAILFQRQLNGLLGAGLGCLGAVAAPCQQAPYLKYLPSYLDKAKIDFYRDSLRRRAVRPPFLTFLTSAHGQQVTYLIWLRAGGLNAIRLTDSTASRPLTNRLQRFSHLLDISKLALRQSEDRLKFKPPINPTTTDALFLETNAGTYLVEYGSGAGYLLNPVQDAARKQFFQALRHDVAELETAWRPAGKYVRRY